jgi:voltage-gated potassium channel
MIYLTSLSFTVMGLYSAAFYMAEGDLNPNLHTYFESLYFTVTVMTGVGLGDITPVTIMGRIISMVMMLSGTAIFVCFTATLSASIMDIELRVLNQYEQQR